MSKWVHEGLKEEKGILSHLKKLGDKKVPHGLDAPHSAKNVQRATEHEASIIHVKVPKV